MKMSTAVNVWIWYSVLELIYYAGKHKDPFWLMIAMITATFLYWLRPVFKQKIEGKED